jgi:hypothetical protein
LQELADLAIGDGMNVGQRGNCGQIVVAPLKMAVESPFQGWSVVGSGPQAGAPESLWPGLELNRPVGPWGDGAVGRVEDA